MRRISGVQASHIAIKFESDVFSKSPQCVTRIATAQIFWEGPLRAAAEALPR
jgi:hypothetical protein